MVNELLFFDKNYFNFYKKTKIEEGKEIISITDCLLDFDNVQKLDEYNQIIDISSMGEIANLQYYAERLFPLFYSDTIFIADNKYRDVFEHNLRYCFKEFKDIDIINEIEVIVENDSKKYIQKLNHIKITDLSNEDVNVFLETFSEQLYGHEKFKDDFLTLINNFRVFNKLGEHKILSLFLMGDSGVGKTEVARAIHKSLGGKKKLAKINFGNYSSDNSLNSLIGSPRGYIGSEEGEIFIRVNNSDTGLILIDEFEKSNSTLFNYFLDVLESGKMVSSISEEIDLNGFIIIFTSNISKEDFTHRISPELRSRFDYKGFFTLLHTEDKMKFVEFRITDIINKFNKNYSISLPPEIYKKINSNINVNHYSNMRDLNKCIKDTFVKSLSEYII